MSPVRTTRLLSMAGSLGLLRPRKISNALSPVQAFWFPFSGRQHLDHEDPTLGTLRPHL